EFHFGATLERVRRQDGYLEVQLAGGSIAADMVVAGIGMLPNMELAVEAGLEVGRGIRVDAHGRSSDPDIFALGDVAEFF
ncbi:FAD-dependent oxidoreductase, partial [Escherichia coli]|uniref:FAD-dependent oxidoreductase n=1 Tax=Escherichia coli TaxID=562 RepID=UPI0028E0976E